ncbi:hypothetical protein D3872_00315 [Massilia cavernae]|uniref:Transaldolase n=2 Tax=Massilia cavernae TaxID=2320864 RepID=A0A418Y8K7_9BURK|nr:hypothetical protein D3872_00315 [Massilia cavernae]
MSVSSATTSRLKSAAELGQQVWLDNLSRDMLDSGELARLIADDGIQGLASNPTVFFNALRSASWQAAMQQARAAPVDGHRPPECHDQDSRHRRTSLV